MVRLRRQTEAEPETQSLRSVQSYYDQTWWDYRFLWLNRRNLAFHFGYHDETTSSHAEALLNTNQHLAARARIVPGCRVLDAGCGVGGSSFWLARERGARAVGITVVHGQVEQAQRLARRQGLAERASFLQADYTCTPFAGESFDAVWALESLCHAPDKARFYREAARVLRPGGRLVVAEYMRTARPSSPDGERMLRQWLDGWAIPDLSTPAEHQRDAFEAGLREVAVEDFTAYARPSLRRLYRIAVLTYPLALSARILRFRSATQHGNVIAATRQYQALERGHWCYGILTATNPPA